MPIKISYFHTAAIVPQVTENSCIHITSLIHSFSVTPASDRNARFVERLQNERLQFNEDSVPLSSFIGNSSHNFSEK